MGSQGEETNLALFPELALRECFALLGRGFLNYH